MKFLKKFAYMLTLTGLVFGLGACSNDDVDYEPAAPVEGAQVYFSNEASTSISATVETTSFEVVVMRGNADEAITVPIKATITAKNVDEEAEPIDYASLFTIPQNVSFGAGKETTKISVGIDRENLEDGQTYNITLSLNDASVITPYGNSSITYTLVVPQPLVLLGTGLYRDDLVASIFNIGGFPEYEVEIYENLKTPGFIYLKNPYGEAFPVNASNFHPYEEDVYFAIDISNPDAVVIPEQPLGLSVDNYGDIWVRMYLDNVGTYKDGIISFGPETMEQAMTLYQGGSYDYLWGCANGMSRLVMPGVVLTDFSLELAYGGFRVAEDNETIYPIARAAYGADVAEIQYAFVAGDITKDAEALNAALNGIEDGSVVSNKVAVTIAGEDEETGEPILEMTLESVEGVEPGVLTVIAIPYSADGEAQYGDLAFTSFYVQGVGAGELPEVEFALYTMSLEDLKEATGDADYIDYYIANGYNSSNTVGVIFEGVDIKSIRPVIFASEEIDMVIEQFGSIEDYIIEYDAYLEANGEDLDYDLTYVTEYGFDYTLMGGNLAPESNYTMFALVANTFGNEQLFSSSFTTEAEDYLSKKGGANLRPAVMKEISLHKEFSSINAISVVSIK